MKGYTMKYLATIIVIGMFAIMAGDFISGIFEYNMQMLAPNGPNNQHKPLDILSMKR